MRRYLLPLVLSLAVAAPLAARAQARVTVELPLVLPRLVVVTPGVQVVPDVNEEVFFTDGYYWVRRDGGWYRSRSHRGGWVVVPGRAVPARLVRIPPGKYRHWHGPPPAAHRERDRGDRGRHRGHGKHGRHD